jgi:hypothetical protein
MKLSEFNGARLRELKTTLKLPMNRIVNDILEKYFNQQIKEVAAMKVTEVEAMVSKKKSKNFNSCCVSYTAKAQLDENDQDHLEALSLLKDQLVGKVQEALNVKQNGNSNHHNGGNGLAKAGCKPGTERQEVGHGSI